MSQYTRRSPEQWKILIQQWQESGLSAPQFCEQNEVGYASFCNWRKRFNAHDLPAEGFSSEAQFIDLQSLTATSADDSKGWNIVLSLGNGVELRLSQS
ncbi:IS66 family insertion sequence element accessory protein TnpA [Oceanospirillum beijerinckii]|uniref:IS66 family insertion sequence element accessory protein TnpA n=1 Tax=Oceanospirillum beijerinckii TaxID=64976 RepID=UPI000405BE6A|nr:hypothetical protein [Oceanospirillum beijerinckii]